MQKASAVWRSRTVPSLSSSVTRAPVALYTACEFWVSIAWMCRQVGDQQPCSRNLREKTMCGKHETFFQRESQIIMPFHEYRPCNTLHASRATRPCWKELHAPRGTCFGCLLVNRFVLRTRLANSLRVACGKLATPRNPALGGPAACNDLSLCHTAYLEPCPARVMQLCMGPGLGPGLGLERPAPATNQC